MLSRPLLAVCLLACLTIVSEGWSAERLPNFILCMSDDQGYGDVAYYGHPHLQTPVLDEMAATGLRFDRFYAAHPVCSPTRGSVMTGRHPNRFGCFSWGHSLRPQEVTIAEALKKAGYATGHFGKWHIGSVRTDCPANPGNKGFDEWVSSPNFYENDPLFCHNGKVIETQGESSMVTVEAALPFMRQAAGRQQPFLAVIWFGNPHTPHEARDELQELYPGLPPAEQNYYGEITGIDRAMGRLRQELEALGIRENTLVWYTSDNGQQARSPGSSGGLRGAKATLWEGGIRVPTIIEWPARIRQPRVTAVPSNTSDIFPTLLELAGLEGPTLSPLDGISLAGVIAGTLTERSEPMGFWVYPEPGIRTPSAQWLRELRDEQTGKSPPTAAPPLTPTALLQKKYDPNDLPGHAALIDGDYKLHRIPRPNGDVALELYHLGDDRAETRNLAASEPERTVRMERQLLDWQRSVIGSLNGDDY